MTSLSCRLASSAQRDSLAARQLGSSAPAGLTRWQPYVVAPRVIPRKKRLSRLGIAVAQGPRMSTASAAPPSFTRALLHRWLVEYNPVYLCSAALVLLGLTLISRALAQGDALWSMLAAPALAELYAFALIGGAAFLARVGHRRPAAMLGLLAVLYQGDLMMNVELSVYLDVVGKLAAAVWVLLFAVKLRALAWALELRLSRSAMLVPSVAALGLAVLPHLLAAAEPSARAAMVALWLFAVGASALWTTREVESAVPWDVRGRRCVRAAWAIWAVLAIGHAAYWSVTWRFDVLPIAIAAPLLVTRWMRREAHVWRMVVGTLAAVALFAPWLFWIAAVMAAATLVLGATREQFVRVESPGATRAAPPYRSVEQLEPVPADIVFHIDARATARLLMGAVVSSYLAVWTARWAGGALPLHPLALTAVLLLVCVAAARHRRRPALALPVAPIVLHAAAQRGWIPEPDGALEWGVAATGAGFVTLLASVWATWHFGRTLPAEPVSEATAE